ncbi:hypothetical protein [Methanogenium organophilum]|uniref:Uncharacterized protein n=1 Tax=Methanogenium organophilum TaxID=2199 RepID=A0A9X9S3R2_METOG|nr:hypothetical protein [Methanogenium organophilum]WAI00996.1 hypothetical protein OU421_11330 [Methanogenium organophilum]
MKSSIRMISIWILFSLLIGAGVFFSGCFQDKNSEISGTSDTMQTPAPAIAQPPSLFVNATPIKPSYPPGETVEVGITFRNTGKDMVVIDSFPPKIILNNPTLGVVRSYPHGSDTITLESGESTYYTMKWDQCDDDGDRTDPGIYFVEISDISYEENGEMNMIFPEGADVAQVIIHYPQGTIERELLISQSKKLNGYIVTLEKIAFNFTASQAYIIVHPSGNSFFEKTDQSDIPTPIPTPPPGLDPSGYYRIDDGPEKDFISTGYNVVDDSIVLVWDFDPVPVNASDLYFVITGLGEWEGYCEIHVDLTKGV